MKFIDEAKIYIRAGHGGRGCVSFRREKFVPRGGPDGGDGGKGGDVVVRTSASARTLLDLKYRQHHFARHGEHGKGSNRTGADSPDVIVVVPVGTVVKDAGTGEIIADLTSVDQEVIAARGGRGGQGNAKFATATRQAPRFAQPGEPGEEKTLLLELKLLADVGIPDGEERLSAYPHQLSGGLLQRVMIASALASGPTLLLADEPTTALDVTTQAEVMRILAHLRRERDLAMLFITHNLELAAATCDRTAVMYAGCLVEVQQSETLHERPLHPYTSGLLCARPSIDHAARRLFVIPGRPVAAFDAGPGCAFAPRCGYAQDRCRSEKPHNMQIGDARVACHRAEELQGSLASGTAAVA